MNANSNQRAPIKLAPAPQASATPAHQQSDTEGGFSTLLRQLSAGVRKEDVKRREGWRDRSGKTHYVDYVEWQTVADLLDRIVPDWSHAVHGVVQIGDFVAVTAAITVN
jgi:hypothetical protein